MSVGASQWWIHAKFDGLNRVGGANGEVFLLIGLDQSNQHVTLIGLFRASSGLKHQFQLPECRL